MTERLADTHPDLYEMETWSIDIIWTVEDLREQQATEAAGNPNGSNFDFIHAVALESARNLRKALTKIIRRLEAHEIP